MQTPCSTLQSLTRALPALWVAFFLAAPASAQVNYVRELVGTGGVSDVLFTIQAPYETSRPDYSSQPSVYLVTQGTVDSRYQIDSATGAVSEPAFFPLTVNLNVDSVVSMAGQNTGTPTLYLINAQRSLVKFSLTTGLAESSAPLSVETDILSSLSARSLDGTLLSLVADQQHYTVNRTTGEMIVAPLAGVNMSSAFYQSYGQDGNLYVLDYGNNRMASFDPNNAFAPVGSFALNTSVTTANQQFAIGINGSFYLADGLGGGSYYNSAGTYQSAFFTPEGTTGDAYIGESYVSTDSSGRVYLFDSATGFHQYQDVAVVPEPGTCALLALGLGLGTLLARRRR